AQGGRGWQNPTAFSPGGSGNGGAIYTQGELTMTNCTLWANRAEGGSGIEINHDIYEPGGPAMGGGLFVQAGSVILQNVTLAGNSAVAGRDATLATIQGGAIFASTNTNVSLRNTILAYSSPGGNCFGTVIDGGHNISSDGTPDFTTVGSKNSTDPVLGPLDDYGGGVLTLPLLAGSPAID